MRASYEQIVPNESCDVGGDRSIAQRLPAIIRKQPNIKRERDPLGTCAQRYKRQMVSTIRGDALNPFNELDEQSFAPFARSIMSREFPVHGILRRLRIASEFQRDGVLRIGAQIVTDQLDRIWREEEISQLPATLPYGRHEQSWNRDALANSPWHEITPVADLTIHSCL